MERGGIPLHDAVGINCKKGATTENQDSAVKYMGQGVYLDDCVCVLPDLTCSIWELLGANNIFEFHFRRWHGC